MALTKLSNNSLGAVTSAGLPAGAVVQVVTNEAGISNTSSTSFVNVVSASITPSSASSKIYAFLSCPGYGGGEGQVKGNARLLRDTTQIQYLRTFWYREASGAFKGSSSSMVKLDSPNTTNTLTYTAQVRRESGSGNLHLTETDNGEWVITLMEIAG